MSFQLRTATRQKVKIKVGMQGPSGSGKTVGALLLAYGITGDWSKIAVVDTENESASLYVNRKLDNGIQIGEFMTIVFKPDYSPERFIEAINVCLESPDIEVVIVDSISHEWMGKGGILDIHEQMGKMNDMQKWSKLTPRHNRFIETILHANKHMILTMRSKQDYVMKEGVSSTGKSIVIPEKVGLKAVTKDGVDYEFTVNFDIDINNFASASKDRTAMFKGKPEFKMTPEIGAQIIEWCELGVDPADEIKSSIDKLSNCDTIDELKSLKDTLPMFVLNSTEFKTAGNKRYSELNTKPA